jgi:hypothetical protein
MGLNWRLRGIGFLYTQKQMLLAAQVHPSGKSVHVFDVLSTDDEARIPRDDCDKLSLWVRVYGPEVYAGTAQTVPATETSDCFWKFDFEVRDATRAVCEPIGMASLSSRLHCSPRNVLFSPCQENMRSMRGFFCGTRKAGITKPSRRASPMVKAAMYRVTFSKSYTRCTLASRVSSFTFQRNHAARYAM